MGKRNEHSFFKGRSPNGQKRIDKDMSNIPGRKRNAIQNHN
jgi:hypothetical protein